MNCLTWDVHSSQRLISTSYDGTSRQLDVENQKASLLFHDPDFLASGGWASFHCQVGDNVLKLRTTVCLNHNYVMLHIFKANVSLK